MVSWIIKRLPLAAAAVLLLPGCAYKYTTTFAILNSSEQTITVRVSDIGSDGGKMEFTLEPGRQRSISTDSNVCPENYMPVDSYNPEEKLPPPNVAATLEIWVGGRKLSDDVRMREQWHYFSTLYAEKYTLPVTEELINDFLEPE